MRQVAIHHHHQNKGLGSLLINEIENYCVKNNINEIYCHARDTAKSFYLKNNYVVEGDEFLEVNIPHYKMKKILS